jgi:hypothetical protein
LDWTEVSKRILFFTSNALYVFFLAFFLNIYFILPQFIRDILKNNHEIKFLFGKYLD